MKYIAHVGIQLRDDNSSICKDTWNIIKREKGRVFQWRLKKNMILEVAVGLFEEKESALVVAKQVFVSTVFCLLRSQIDIQYADTWQYETRFFDSERDGSLENYEKNETFFFWDKHYQGNSLGPGVYEVESSLDELSEYGNIDISLLVENDRLIDLSKVDQFVFTYTKDNQSVIDTLVLADKTFNEGIKMMLYCGLLEHIAGRTKKQDSIISLIDHFIEETDRSQLLQEQKEQLKNYLSNGKMVSAQQRCKSLCKKYTNKKYRGFTTDQIINEAYKIRSAFSHGDKQGIMDYSLKADCMKYVVLDVVEAYMREQEIEGQNNE